MPYVMFELHPKVGLLSVEHTKGCPQNYVNHLGLMANYTPKCSTHGSVWEAGISNLFKVNIIDYYDSSDPLE